MSVTKGNSSGARPAGPAGIAVVAEAAIVVPQ
jgi:hypothetical protein